MQKLNVMFGNIAETVGLKLLPFVNKGATALQKFVTGIQNGTGAGGRFAGAFGRVVATVKQALPGIIAFARSLIASFRQAVGPIRPIGTAVLLVGQRVAHLAKAILPGFTQAFRGVFQVVGGIIRTIAALIHGDFSGAFKGLKSIVSGSLNVVKGVVRGAVGAIVGVFGGMGGRIAKAASGAFDGLKTAFKSALNFIIRAWNGLNFHIGGTDLGPLGHLPDINIGTPDIPEFARGVRNFRGGMAVVGERGPEIVNLPRGSDVLTNRESSTLMNAGGISAGDLEGMLRRLIAEINSRPVVVSRREVTRGVVGQLTHEQAFS
jgi:phage-related protein